MHRKLVPGVVPAMTPAPVIEHGASVRAAARRLADDGLVALVVMDAAEKPIGIVGARELVFGVLAEGRDADATPVSAVMQAGPDLLTDTDSALDALALMRARDYRYLPVVTADGHVVAVVGREDLIPPLNDSVNKALTQAERDVFGEEPA